MLVRGNIFDYRYSGSNNLLVNGAKCILNATDILKNYPQIEIKKRTTKKEKIAISDEYKEIYRVLLKESQNVNSLSRILDINISELNSKLILMEMERINSKRKW